MELQDTSQRITYWLNEGKYTNEGIKLSQLGEVEIGSFEKQCFKNDFVQLSKSRDSTMEKATTVAEGMITGPVQGNIPKETTAFADLGELRRGAITLFSSIKVFNAPLADDAGKITPGDLLIIDNVSGKLTTTTETSTGCKAEESKLANEGGFINVMVIDNGIKVKQATSTGSGTTGDGG